MEGTKRRYVGIDLGKREWTMAIIGKNGKMSIYQGKTSIQGRQALYRLLEKGGKAALEAGNLAFIMAREIMERAGCEVRVLNCAKLPFIWDAPTKTDKEDAIKLAHLVEERRDEKLPFSAAAERKGNGTAEGSGKLREEMKNRTRHINTLHAIFVHQGHTAAVKKNLATAEKRQDAVQILTGLEREEAEWILKYPELHEQRIKELKGKIHREAKKDKDMKNLQTIPGVGPVAAYVFAAHVGDGSRFRTGAQVSNYIGFVPRLDYSGTIQRNGSITKRGNGYLRGLLVQAAWSMVRCKRESSLKDRYICLTVFGGRGKKKTIVSIGRRLAELMYSVLRDKSSYEARIWSGRREYLTKLKELRNSA